jgi:hypothetical protein
MLLLLSQTITSAKILRTPKNTEQKTKRPVPVMVYQYRYRPSCQYQNGIQL